MNASSRQIFFRPGGRSAPGCRSPVSVALLRLPPASSGAEKSLAALEALISSISISAFGSSAIIRLLFIIAPGRDLPIDQFELDRFCETSQETSIRIVGSVIGWGGGGGERMIYTEHIQKALEYIERHLTEACTLEDCARAAGYSAYHFARIFKGVTGLSPMDYVRKRRLSAAARDVAKSAESILDIAVKWGFESSETFIRAFEAEHGLTPGRYRSTGICLHLTSPFRILTGIPFALPEPMILEIPERVLCGFPLYLEPDMRHGTIPSFFNQYHQKRLAYLLPGVPADGRFDDVGCSIYEGKRRLAYIVGVWADRLGPPRYGLRADSGWLACRIRYATRRRLYLC